MKSKRVLIVDDHRDSADMLALVLKASNGQISVQGAYDGTSGLALALTGQFDVVILDLRLPGMSGVEVAREIRLKLSSAAPLLIALSGSVADVAQLQGGPEFDHAITKPVDLDRLFLLLP